MGLPTLLAVSSRWEADLAAGLDAEPDVAVVRRCADLADLLAAAGAGLARGAVVSSDLDGLDAEVLRRLRRGGVEALVLLADPTLPDPGSAAAVAAAGGAHLLPAGSGSEQVAEVLLSAAAVGGAAAPWGSGPAAAPDAAASSATSTAISTRLTHLDLDVRAGDAGLPPSSWELDLTDDGWVPPIPPAPPAPASPGAAPTPPPVVEGPVVVAVWGPAGAPGRTTVAITLATEMARLGRSSLLVDADSYASSVSAALGLLEEGSGLAAAVRAATAGRLDDVRLAELAPVLAPGLRVLTGLPTAGRWHELRPAGLDVVWATARAVAEWTFVDVAPVLESDEDLMFDTTAPRRNQATLSALQSADLVVAVGSADPIGLQRLVRGLQELADVVPGTPVRVVVTKVRPSAVGGSPARRIAEVLQRFTSAQGHVLVPDDRDACDAALLAGLSLTESAPSSPARLALADLAASWVGAAPTGRGRRAAARGPRGRARGRG
ncbi:MAG: hypothetical protein U0Q15_17645 [Kineosporiaceae bacterium]